MQKNTKNNQDMHYTFRIMLRAGLIALALGIVMVVILLIQKINPLKYFLGLLVGAGINILLFRLHYLNLSALMDRNSNAAKKGAMFNYTTRYFITAIVLGVSYLSPYLSFWTCALGFLMIKLSIYLEYLMVKKSEK